MTPEAKGESKMLARIEELRGEPLRLIDVDNIPCREVSDVGRLCRAPLVSVVMITYNHAPFIRRAIESVVAQHADFPFELVIGEDCSTDETRAIVLACQQAHPEIIRVLFSERNVGGSANALRAETHCRGRYIAYCEGDDYWIDTAKLQVQARMLEQNLHVGLVFCSAKTEWYDGTLDETPPCFADWPDDADIRVKLLQNGHIYTCGAMVRTTTIHEAIRANPLFRSDLCLGDLTHWLEALRTGKGVQIRRNMAVYVRHRQSVSHTNMVRIFRDAAVVRYWYATTEPGLQGYAADMLRVLARERIYEAVNARVPAATRRKTLRAITQFARREGVVLTGKEKALLVVGYLGMYRWNQLRVRLCAGFRRGAGPRVASS